MKLASQITVPVYNAAGVKFYAVFNEGGTHAIYEAGSGRYGPDGIETKGATDTLITAVTLDVPFVDFQSYAQEQRISAPLYNTGQCLAQLLP